MARKVYVMEQDQNHSDKHLAPKWNLNTRAFNSKPALRSWVRHLQECTTTVLMKLYYEKDDYEWEELDYDLNTLDQWISKVGNQSIYLELVENQREGQIKFSYRFTPLALNPMI